MSLRIERPIAYLVGYEEGVGWFPGKLCLLYRGYEMPFWVSRWSKKSVFETQVECHSYLLGIRDGLPVLKSPKWVRKFLLDHEGLPTLYYEHIYDSSYLKKMPAFMEMVRAERKEEAK